MSRGRHDLSHAGGSHVGHGHARADAKRLRLALLITSTLLVAEVVGGIVSNSIALLADAGHMLTDVAALGLSLFVAWFAHQPRTARKTYGYLRWEILAALINGVTLLLLSAWIIWESLARFNEPQPVAGGMMLGVAVAGLIANLAAARVLHPSSGSSLNVRGAYLHVVGDLLASVGTVVAAVVIWRTGWLAADPLASLLTTALIVRGAWNLVRESVDVLLEAAPAHVSPDEIRKQLEAIPGLESLHDLHVWSVSTGLVAMSAHAVVNDPELHQPILEQAHAAMKSSGIEHVTIQLERHATGQGEQQLHQLARKRS